MRIIWPLTLSIAIKILVYHLNSRQFKKFQLFRKGDTMKLSSISNSEIRFGNIYTIRGTTKYHISPFEQKALAGIFKKGIPNTFMRFRASVMYWLPCKFRLIVIMVD